MNPLQNTDVRCEAGRPTGPSDGTVTESSPYVKGMEVLVAVVQELSLARDLDTVMAIVRRAARRLTGADGATFVLREGELCHYAEEDAIAPLWKGRRFPMQSCISGWSMLHRQAAVIEDIYADPRIPADAYRPTFVKSLVIVPIRTVAPIGAIGNYWARTRRATSEEVALLSALADSTSIAMENVALYDTLETRVRDRTAELASSRADLAAKHEMLIRVQRQKDDMAALLVHDLKSPTNGILMACQARLRNRALSDSDREYWKSVQAGAEVIHRMALNLLDITRSEDGCFAPERRALDLPLLLGDVMERMTPLAEGLEQTLSLSVDLDAGSILADGELLGRVLQNLVDNALRYNPLGGTVRLLASESHEGSVDIRVIDAGPGIPEAMRRRVFDKYTRLGPGGDRGSSAGRGLGLAFCRLAVESHGGMIWVEPNEPQGSVFVVRLPRAR